MTLTQEILSSLYLADKVAAWGTLGTIKPLKNFEPEADVDRITEILTNKGNVQTIVDIVTNLNNDQRQDLARLYKAELQKDLEEDIKKVVSGDLEKVIVGLLKAPAAFDAQELKSAMKGLGTDEETLTEILSTRSNDHLREIQTCYRQEYKAELEKDITSDTKEPYTGLLLALAKGKRERDSGIIDYSLIEQDSKILNDLGPKNTANSAQWITILTERSHGHLRRVFDHFKKSTKGEIEEWIKKNFKGDFQKGLLTLVAVIKNTPLYFADRLYNAMKGLGTDDSTLRRILVSRSEVDLLSIRVAYRRKYGKSLYSSIQSDTKGTHRSALLLLCRAEDI
ncbi:annexin A9 isoform X2 [Hyla sarda]|uniref:annexin A9 isoform X2 n=1 Tax=Hyla sarda TaxID=327740 RepID=UPI0024C37D22|nr:annexin A9 isoform X2 [Hyla sarda]XP_056401680.1 annexin A9 isoform X2 [Hyla sarda]XP_056401681.1 annexin A9 isoform X2 [Hyla sarda]XP_056401682.1 annexin A9 isoform X2 [Hyla sarda]XP_056401684.1 annexin A9 isoform X2 [Hyla sarda]XP_056401685.1 annexin A9 isoform X2 [Hyla sarda]